MNNTHFDMIIGASGSGKTSGVLIPEILKSISNEDSFMVTDPKSEILDYIGNNLIENNYKIININLRNVEISDRWNPLILPYKYFKSQNYQKCYSLLYNVANTIFQQGIDKEDPFWTLSSRDLFVGLAFCLFEDANSIDEVNLKSIYHMEASGNKKRGSTTLLNFYYNTKKDVFSYANSCLRGIVTAPPDTRNSIISVFNQKLRAITMNERYLPIVCENSFDIEDCLKEKTAFIFQYEDETFESSYIINILIQQIIEFIIDRRTKLKNKHIKNFDVFLDDFLTLDKFPNIDTLLLSSKRRGINILLSINSINLFEKYYDVNTKYALFDNADRIILTNSCDAGVINYFKEVLISNSDNFVLKDLLKLHKFEAMYIDKEFTCQVKRLHSCNKSKSNWIPRKKGINEIAYFDLEHFINNYNVSWLNQINYVHTNQFDMDSLIEKIDKKMSELSEKNSDNKNQ